MAINGIINVYKEKGYTSHDVVGKLRRILGMKKIGHTGTLDPDAEGVLPVGLGFGTKVCDMLTASDKEYVAELLLGITTDTEDMTGEILTKQVPDMEPSFVKEIIYGFKGDYLQTPPMYSAIKVNGRKLYELAREGKEIERKSRKVSIKDIEVLSYYIKEGFPVYKIRVLCSKGTYIRTLCSDIGKKCGCGGVMASLLRTRSGRFSLENAHKLCEIEELNTNGSVLDIVLPVDNVFGDHKSIRVKDDYNKLLVNGNPLYTRGVICKDSFEALDDGEWVRVYSSLNEFVAVYSFVKAQKRFMPVKMFTG